jgi:hypothetical protein
MSTLLKDMHSALLSKCLSAYIAGTEQIFYGLRIELETGDSKEILGFLH